MDPRAVPGGPANSEVKRQTSPTRSPLDRSKIKPSNSELPPLITSTNPHQFSAAPTPRVAAAQSKRLSTFSLGANSGINRSRPDSISFPAFHSSLDFALVRDFAYQPWHPLHYGPTPDDTTDTSTPVDEMPRRGSEPSSYEQWDEELDGDDAAFHGANSAGGVHLPATAYKGDGPPWREDEDLHSPVVTSAKHKKSRSSTNYFSIRPHRALQADNGRRTSYAGTDPDGSQLYYVDQDGETQAGGPGGELITLSSTHAKDGPWQGGERDESDDREYLDEDDSRYSKDYTFTIASPDEEMHGKAVALFDFARENDNELPLVEGQVLWVSYRHGQGWLVAQDPKSGESGLVPEAYVRLLRDIEGGLNGLNGHLSDESPLAESDVPASQQSQAHSRKESNKSTGSNRNYETPIISHFSTSSRDLQPYPSHLLGSQANTPVHGPADHLPASRLPLDTRGMPLSAQKADGHSETPAGDVAPS